MMKYLLRPFAAVYPTRLCACSRTAGSWLYGEKPFRVFNNAIELDRFTYDAAKRKAVRQELGLGDELVLGHVGRFCYAKNHEFLLDVMAEVCKQRPDAVLLLIGEGENEAAARRKAEALGLQRNVRFLGRQSDPAKFYQAMDAFVLPSRYEGLGIVLIEAQAAALPVICSISRNKTHNSGMDKATIDNFANSSICPATDPYPASRQTDAEKSATYVIPSIFNSAFKSAGSTGSVSISSRKKSRINEILDSVYPKIKTDAAIPTSNASSPFSFFSKRARKTAAIPIIPIFIIDITYETGFPSL